MEDMLYTVEEVAQILKTNKNFVYELIRKGYLTGLKLGRLKVTKFELVKFLRKYNGKDLTDLNNIRDLNVIPLREATTNAQVRTLWPASSAR